MTCIEYSIRQDAWPEHLHVDRIDRAGWFSRLSRREGQEPESPGRNGERDHAFLQRRLF